MTDSLNETVAVIGGSGDFGYGLALRWTIAGVPVIIGSRDAAKAQTAAAEILEQARLANPGGSPSIRGMENAEAAAGASVVVVAVPFPAQAPTLKSIRTSLAKTNPLLVDVTVPLAASVGGKPTRMLGVWQGSAAEQAREMTPPEVPVLSAFHNVSGSSLRDAGFRLDCDVLVCGDAAEAKKRLFALIRSIVGLRPVDAGALEMARIVEGMTALLISLNRRYKVTHTGIRITGLGAD